MTTTGRNIFRLGLCSAALLASSACAQPKAGDTTPASGVKNAPSWRAAEAPALDRHVQLTFPSMFVKAGEAYFSGDSRWIVFQAVPIPPEGEDPSPHYLMYVAKLLRDSKGHVTSIEMPILLSPEGSANTCGFFHPHHPWQLIFGSTLVPPSSEKQPGYQRDASRYLWQFPVEMDVVSRVVPAIHFDMQKEGLVDQNIQVSWGSNAVVPEPMWERMGYDAECAYSPNGRLIVYTAVDPDTGDGDIFIYDTKTERSTPIITEQGYDGGPFFSPDGKRICFRSDRAGNDLLQIYVADLRFNADGSPAGVEHEYTVTQNHDVNWAPFWHPSGRFLLYTTSEVSHRNYEVFAIQAPAQGSKTAISSLWKRRITTAEGFDGMPVFNAEGDLMMWTSQRGKAMPGEKKPSSQVWIAEFGSIER